MGRTLITGATNGIGLALARYYLHQAERPLLIGRRPLAEVPLSQFPPDDYCRVDLAQPDCAEQVETWLDDQKIEQLDILIHNAGVGYYGSAEAQSWASIQNLVEVNLWAPIALTHKLIPRLMHQRGKVVFISSVVSAVACPDYAVYGATKAALDGFARSLRIEMKGRVDIQVIHPGATRTGMHAKSGLDRETIDWDRFPRADVVAEKIARAISSNKPSVTIGVQNRVLRIGGAYFGGIFDWFLRRRYR